MSGGRTSRREIVTIHPGVTIERADLHYTEAQLRQHRGRVQALAVRETELAWAQGAYTERGGTRGGHSDPTFAAFCRTQADETRQRLQRRIAAVEAALSALSPLERQILDMLYLSSRYQVPGVAMRLHLSERHVRRLRNEALYTCAVALGIIT